MSNLERSPERDAAIEAMLPLVPLHGWTVATLQMAAGPDADLLFPDGAAELVEAYCDLGDRWMEADVGGGGPLRSAPAGPGADADRHAACGGTPRTRSAVRRGLAVLAVPGRGMQAARVHRAHRGRHLARGGRYLGRFQPVHQARDPGGGVWRDAAVLAAGRQHGRCGETLAFLDRRLAGIGRFGRARKKDGGDVRALPRPLESSHAVCPDRNGDGSVRRCLLGGTRGAGLIVA